MESIIGILIPAAILVVAVLVIGMIFARLYRRASKDTSYVRTGLGGSKVIKDGGALILPVVHEIRPVSLKTHKLIISKRQGEALITNDNFRADVVVEFYVRVRPDAEAIQIAAQTLGNATNNPDDLRTQVEGKFTDALRAVAASMPLKDLHLKRAEFVQKVLEAVKTDLEKNGLELETASLTGLDQTDEKYFNPGNAFDAEGLTKLKQVIEAKRKERFDIEQSTEVEIARKQLEATREKLNLERETQEATLAQEQELANKRAQQEASIAREQAARRKEAEEARIQADREIEEANISKAKMVESANIQKDIEISEKSQAKIEADRSRREKEIEAQRALDEAEINRKKSIDMARQQSEAEVAEKSKVKSAAEAEASKARSEAVKAEEGVQTAREVEAANRAKAVQLVRAEQEAEEQAIGVRVAAQAEKDAAEERAQALRIQAQADAEAEKTRAEAKAETYRVEAEGQMALNEARNKLSPEVIAMQVKQDLIANLPKILEQVTAPMKQIDSIKIIQVDGLGGTSGGDSSGAAANSNIADQVTGAALKYVSQRPMIEGLLREVGLHGGLNAESLGAMASGFGDTAHEVVSAPEGKKPTDPKKKAS